MKPVVLYVKKIKTYNFDHWIFSITKNKDTQISHKTFVFYRKWKINNGCFRRAICCIPWNFLNQTRHDFLHVSNVLGCAEACACDRTSHMPKPAWSHKSQKKNKTLLDTYNVTNLKMNCSLRTKVLNTILMKKDFE